MNKSKKSEPIYAPRYSMVICEAGHHLTGEGEAPGECPVCVEAEAVRRRIDERLGAALRLCEALRTKH